MPLLALPNELLLHIAQNLSVQEDISVLCQANRRLYDLLQDYLYWYNAQHDKSSALVFGALRGLRAVVEKSLRAKPLDIDAPPLPTSRRYMGHNAVCIAINRQHPDLVELLLSNGASIHGHCRGKVTYLGTAAQHGNLKTMQVLLDRGASIHATDGNGMTALHHAVAWNHLASVDFLLDRGADITAMEYLGQTPLCKAALHGNMDCIQHLIKRGASAELQSPTGRRALYIAMGSGHAEISQLLLDRGVILEKREELFHRAAQYGYLACLEMLLKLGVPVDCKGENNTTALYYAASDCTPSDGGLDIITRLLDAGADMNIRSFHDRTPLFAAALRGQKSVAKLLLDRGADPNAYVLYAGEPQTALWGVLNGDMRNWDIAELLLERGANPNLLCTLQNQHPLVHPKEYPDDHMLQLMLSKGADMSRGIPCT
ncbi:hypothetical protein NUU61_008267 [Penicillium alfredii]|uniref:F-box domain-containing protein n=1 Tax=Penicillium alfredii TaxID=1506179 RepID=A0A9W9ESC8_9EURO|nr:uncharacterized protein NUU61_008267 [Penicillium alfredii]KAJ5086960.1 hypothetical protein NUU61_008267 [Penicillium alfredii]